MQDRRARWQRSATSAQPDPSGLAISPEELRPERPDSLAQDHPCTTNRDQHWEKQLEQPPTDVRIDVGVAFKRGGEQYQGAQPGASELRASNPPGVHRAISPRLPEAQSVVIPEGDLDFPARRIHH